MGTRLTVVFLTTVVGNNLTACGGGGYPHCASQAVNIGYIPSLLWLVESGWPHAGPQSLPRMAGAAA
eukprot:CAMPEP_0174322640 /NCGR_PEP_ID=MMETSP0810-20121108/11148_1 /TAXON_ID=73025 ORGANISM="Eutreptiella gymnastica-like, Strain CCMP1594" /NCGR_SAMPLE_ID=MMETSP0810 /ASSEMBLY_ACC=CAM_ASM_000659 /LENGTH=66 /DNA_ID=CAMNT_0015434547 /DNA_START=133 /DNA_END=333 /DNA_ORIENTATION=+